MKFHYQYLLFLLALGLIAGGCKKQDGDIYIAPDQASLRVYNATDSAFNIYQNGTRLSNSANIGVGGASNYLEVLANQQRFAFKTPYNVLTTGQNIARNDTLSARVLTLDSGKQYSLFVGGTTKTTTTFLVPDTNLKVDAGNVSIRFVHAAPVAGPLRITFNDNVLQLNNVKYQSVHSQSITPAASPVSMVVKLYKANGTTPVYTSQTFEFETGKKYTIFARDSASNTVSIGRHDD